MGFSSPSVADGQKLYHVVSLLSDDFLRFNSVDSIERDLLTNAANLFANGVRIFTVYDWRGIIRLHFLNTYGNCRRRQVRNVTEYKTLSFQAPNYFDLSREFEITDNSILEYKGVYFLEIEDSGLLLSQHDRSQHSSAAGIQICFMDRSHAHTRILNSSTCSYPLPTKWIMCHAAVVSGKAVEYCIPTEDHINQPHMQNQLYLIDDIELTSPDLVISVQCRIRDVLCFFLVFIYVRWVLLFTWLFPLLFTRPMAYPPLGLRFILRSIVTRIGNTCFLGKSMVHQFGPCGAPPWFLSMAELHQCFGFSSVAIENCISGYRLCEKRNGK
ncbi:uncharacterized protein BXIN_1616 [Babesia sp. Xinjiang]|uniref:uncharacterized protein n=1 Tax=Babesia sp. Xinjiang TaxID=462227 RepID=UPI000A251A0B|nr:uncharacterized protein BXIN_1803 [Babesia sp. Xinjiang]XP_028871466.1 uncharacterized protein BXIN_1616 [Babesia sp. Xinjiang]ORM40945.1 hypothetical protein BXIN_1803 [Babesia sp. Xinjiang]ORM41010.1 hypothetical protein BXIN_1616 [Babesia sp. Xinjiang]